MIVKKQIIAHIPIRNPFHFQKLLLIDGDFGRFLLIPKSLIPAGPYSNDDWVNRRTAYFPGQDSYLLITSGDHDKQTEVEDRLLRAVNPIIFEVNTKFKSALAPHAMTARELVPDTGVLEGGAITVSPELQPEQFTKDSFTQNLLNSLNPYYSHDRGRRGNVITFLLGRQKNLGQPASLEELVDALNQVNDRDFRDHAAATLGNLILEFIEDELPGADENTIQWAWGEEALNRLQDKKLESLLGDFLADLHGRKNANRFKSQSRRYDEYGDFGGPISPPSQLDVSQAPQTLRKNFYLKQDLEFLTEQETKNAQGFVSGLLDDIRANRPHEKTFAQMRQQLYKIKPEELQIVDKKMNDERLSYYVETYSASRPGMKFLHLYQVIESLTTRGHELTKLKALLNTHFPAVNDLDPELTAFMNTFTPPVPFDSKLLIHAKTIDDMANSIYSLRCMVSHSRELTTQGGPEFRIVPYSRQEYEIVPAFFELMDKIARKLLTVP